MVLLRHFGAKKCYNIIMNIEVLLAIIGIVPTMTTIVISAFQERARRKDNLAAQQREDRNSAKSSIQNMITQDIIRAEILGKMPENRDNIEAEYARYAKNGGNGTIARQVKEYNEWIEQFKPSKNDPTRIA